jgi:putative ABC transport system substrate-binding protein
MRRRDLITLVGGAAAAWPLAASAQQSGKVPSLGYLSGDSDSADLPRRNAFREGLHKLGYNEGQTILIEYRTAAGSIEKLSTFAAEFSHLSVNVIFAFTAGATQAAARAMPTKPIVSVTADLVSAGFVASLARPGGNITGLSTLAGTEMYGKYLELLKNVVPNLTRVAVLSNPTFSALATSALALKAMEAAAPTLGLALRIIEARSPDELEAAMAAAVVERAAGLGGTASHYEP